MEPNLKVGGCYTSKVTAPVVDAADVIVAGGGTAGCIAALAAARAGARVLLVERTGVLGGMMTSGNAGLTKYIVHEKSSAEYRKVLAELATNPPAVQVVGGLPMEITEKLLEMKAAVGTAGTAGSYVFTSSEDFKWLLLTMLEESGVKLMLHSLVVDVIREKERVAGLIVENKSGRQAVLAEVFIDATGDGDVAAKSGVPFEIGVGPDDISAKAGIPLQSMGGMGVMFRAGNIDMARCFTYLIEHPDKYAMQGLALMDLNQAHESFKQGEMMTINIKSAGHEFQIYNTPIYGVFIFCCPSYDGSGLSVRDLTRGEAALYREVRKRVLDMKKSLPGFEDCYLLDRPQICVRETRHIAGEYKLNFTDIYSGRKFRDTIGRGCHPVDVTPIPKSLEGRSLPPRWYFNIPYRCLVARGIDNILVAGRCISATHEASGCIRTTVQCMVTGEAAGTAAAMCARRKVKPKDLSVGELRRTLKARRVIL